MYNYSDAMYVDADGYEEDELQDRGAEMERLFEQERLDEEARMRAAYAQHHAAAAAAMDVDAEGYEEAEIAKREAEKAQREAQRAVDADLAEAERLLQATLKAQRYASAAADLAEAERQRRAAEKAQRAVDADLAEAERLLQAAAEKAQKYAASSAGRYPAAASASGGSRQPAAASAAGGYPAAASAAGGPRKSEKEIEDEKKQQQFAADTVAVSEYVAKAAAEGAPFAKIVMERGIKLPISFKIFTREKLRETGIFKLVDQIDNILTPEQKTLLKQFFYYYDAKADDFIINLLKKIIKNKGNRELQFTFLKTLLHPDKYSGFVPEDILARFTDITQYIKLGKRKKYSKNHSKKYSKNHSKKYSKKHSKKHSKKYSKKYSKKNRK